jgi:Family of unknown function (DUF6232)
MILVGALVSLVALGAMLGDGDRDDLPVERFALILGLLFTCFGIYALKRAKGSYAVILNTAGSEMKTCISQDRDFVLRVVSALNEAIVARG